MEPGEELFILAFDHRGSFQSKWFGIEGEPTDDETLRIADGKELIFEGLELAPSKGAQAATAGGLVDEQFGVPKRIPDRIRAAGMKLAMPVEKSGQTEFDFAVRGRVRRPHRTLRPRFRQGPGPLQP